MQVEANQFRKECDQYLEGECAKIQAVIDKYKDNPKLSKKELGVGARNEKEASKPLTEQEFEYICRMKTDTENLICGQNT